MKIILTKGGFETVKAKEVKFEFHHFHVTFEGCRALDSDITLVYAYERGGLSAWCCTGLKGKYKPRLKNAILNLAKELAKGAETSVSRDFEKNK